MYIYIYIYIERERYTHNIMYTYRSVRDARLALTGGRRARREGRCRGVRGPSPLSRGIPYFCV